MRLRVLLCAGMLFAPTLSVAFAAESPWSGTWKEDVSKSQSGNTMTITAAGSGYHFSNGSTIAYDFACDGKQYPTSPTQTLGCTPAAGNSLDFKIEFNGKVTRTQHRTFSPDGKTMTINETSFLPDGTQTTSVLVRQRKSGTTGLVGEWADAKVSSSQPDLDTWKVSGDMIRVSFAHTDTVEEGKMDGSEGKVTGSRVPPGTSFTLKTASPTKLLYASKLNGKTTVEGTFTLSADGKTMTFVSWLAGKEAGKSIEVYNKQ